MMTLIHSMMGLGTVEWGSSAEGFPLPWVPPSDYPLERGEHPHGTCQGVSCDSWSSQCMFWLARLLCVIVGRAGTLSYALSFILPAIMK
jgi:hypothetical protein